MRPILQSAFLALGLAGCSGRSPLTPAEFTQQYAKALKSARPDVQFSIAADLEIKAITGDEGKYAFFLDNAYGEYKLSPDACDEVIARFVSSNLETINRDSEGFDSTRIVPVIKHNSWLENTRAAIANAASEKSDVELIYEDYNEELIIVYAQDSPRSMSFLTDRDLVENQIDRTELRKLACENLQRLLPKIERHGKVGMYMVTAGGTYEASLLLLESMWTKSDFDVRGEIVVAIPTRDVLLVTGSDDRDGLARLERVASEDLEEGSYRISSALFVFRDGRFEPYSPDAK